MDKLEQAKKLAVFAKNPELAQYLEVQNLSNKLDIAIESLQNLADKEPPETAPFPDFPEQKEVIFPDIQKVEVSNFPKTEAPIIKISPPKVEVNVPDVIVPEIIVPEIDTKGIEQAIKDSKLEIPLDEERVAVKLSEEDLKKIGEATGKNVKVFGGGGNGLAIEAAVKDVKTAIEAQGGGVAYDSIYLTQGTTDDVWTYKLLGATVQTTTINYTDSSKAIILSVIKS